MQASTPDDLESRSRISIYLASMKHYHYMLFFTPIPLLSTAFIYFISIAMAHQTTRYPVAPQGFAYNVMHFILFYIVPLISLFFYPLVIHWFLNGRLKALIIPRKYADVKAEANYKYNKTPKHWERLWYGPYLVNERYNDLDARLNAESVHEGFAIATVLKMLVRFVIYEICFILGPLMLFLLPKYKLEF